MSQMNEVNYWVKGGSSFLFVISLMKAISCSELIMWKISVSLLVIASFLCNANDFREPYLLVDYLSIFFVTMSYMNRMVITLPLCLALAYEYKYCNTIEATKNVAFVITVVSSITNTYLYVDKTYFYVIIISSLSGSTIYYARYYLHMKGDYKFYRILTYLFHVCITNIIYVSSITAK